MSDNPILDALQMKGVLISVSVRFWRGRKKLRPEDLGLDPDTIDDRLFSLGQKRLVTKEALAPFSLIEGRTHALVDASSFPFLGGIARYVPYTNLETLLSRLASLRSDFEQERDKFIANYSETRSDALRAWSEAAQRLQIDPSNLMKTILEAFPLPEEMESHFTFTHRLFQITAPEEIRLAAFDMAESQAVREARMKAAREAQQSIKKSTEEFVENCVTTLRSETAQLCGEMLQTMNGSGSVNQKTLNRLVRFIDRFRTLNFVGDEEMEKRLEDVRQELLACDAASYRKDTRARNNLVDGLRALRQQAKDLATQDASLLVENFGALGKRKFAGVA